jgi:hypothetical protein
MARLLTDRYHNRLAGVLSCCDRIVITGTLPGACFAEGMTRILKARGIRVFDYPTQFAAPLRDRVREAARLAAAAGITIEHIARSYIRKENVAPLNLQTIKTILGCKHRPKYRRRTKRPAEWEVAVERPTYDLTIFKLHCGKLTLKIYTKGERVLRIEAVAHNTRELHCGRSLEMFPEVLSRLKAILERFADALSCIDQCFIADEMLESLPLASQVGKTLVGGIDLNKARMRRGLDRFVPLTQWLHRLRRRCSGRASNRQTPSQYGPRRAAYDLKKLRGKHSVRRIGHTRRYEPLDRSQGDDSLGRSPQQGYQAPSRCRSAYPPSPWSTQPKTDRSPLPGHNRCNARRLS